MKFQIPTHFNVYDVHWCLDRTFAPFIFFFTIGDLLYFETYFTVWFSSVLMLGLNYLVSLTNCGCGCVVIIMLMPLVFTLTNCPLFSHHRNYTRPSFEFLLEGPLNRLRFDGRYITLVNVRRVLQ